MPYYYLHLDLLKSLFLFRDSKRTIKTKFLDKRLHHLLTKLHPPLLVLVILLNPSTRCCHLGGLSSGQARCKQQDFLLTSGWPCPTQLEEAPSWVRNRPLTDPRQTPDRPLSYTVRGAGKPCSAPPTEDSDGKGEHREMEEQVKEETLVMSSTCLKRNRPSYWGCNKSTSHVKSNAMGWAGCVREAKQQSCSGLAAPHRVAWAIQRAACAWCLLEGNTFKARMKIWCRLFHSFISIII